MEHEDENIYTHTCIYIHTYKSPSGLGCLGETLYMRDRDAEINRGTCQLYV